MSNTIKALAIASPYENQQELEKACAELGWTLAGREAERQWSRASQAWRGKVDALMHWGSPGQHLNEASIEAIRMAKSVGASIASLSFNGERPQVRLEEGSEDQLVELIRERFEQGMRESSRRYERSKKGRDERAKRIGLALQAKAQARASLEILMRRMEEDKSASRLEMDPEFYEALGRWTRAADHREADAGGAMVSKIRERLLQAGFKPNAEVGEDMSDPILRGRWAIGQWLSMSAPKSEGGLGVVHPRLADHLEELSRDGKLRAIQEKKALSQASPIAGSKKAPFGPRI